MKIELLFLFTALSGCATPTRPQRSPTAAATQPAQQPAIPRVDVPGIANFAKVSDVLYRGAQPDEHGLTELKKLGIRTIVDLRSNHDDAKLLAGMGFQYVYLPQTPWSLTEMDAARFLQIVEDPKNQPVFVHCAQGADRTGFAVAAYRIVEQQMPPESAIAELHQFQYHAIFGRIPRMLVTLDAEKLKKQIKLLPAPAIRVIQ